MARSLMFLFLLSFYHGSFATDFRFDHAVVVVNDIEAASGTYRSLGFTVKPGRLHDNGLLNSFVQFSDSTELELMSVSGVAKDHLAREYAKLLAERGESGAYIALTGPELTTASTLLKSLGVEHKLVLGQLWDYLTFPKESGLGHFFFIKMHRHVKDPEELYRHGNGIVGTNTIWIEGAEPVRKLLTAFGGKPCGDSHNTIVLSGTSFVLMPPQQAGTRPGFVGLGLSGASGNFKTVENAHGIFLRKENVTCGESLNNQRQVTPKAAHLLW